MLAVAGSRLRKTTKLYKAIAKNGEIVDRKLEKSDLPGFARKLFHDQGREVEAQAVSRLVSLLGDPKYDDDLLLKLSAEVDKVITYVGDRPMVTCQDIESVTVAAASTKIWELSDAIGNRECHQALSKAAALIAEGASVQQLHGNAVRTVRNLIAVHAVLDRGGAMPKDVMAAVGLKTEWQVKRLMQQACRFQGDELVGLLEEAAKAEEQMKTSRDNRLVLETWIAKACGADLGSL